MLHSGKESSRFKSSKKWEEKRVFILDIVSGNSSTSEKDPSLLQRQSYLDLQMGMILDGGAERDRRQWEELLEGAGFVIVGVTHCGNSDFDVIECKLAQHKHR